MDTLFSGAGIWILIMGAGVALISLIILIRGLSRSGPSPSRGDDAGAFGPVTYGHLMSDASSRTNDDAPASAHPHVPHHGSDSAFTHHHDHGVSFGHSDSSSGGFDGGGGGGDGGGGGGGD